MSDDALTVDQVDVAYRVHRRDQRVLRDVSFHIARGESYGLVGESGIGQVDDGARDRSLPRAQRTRALRLDHDRRP